MNRESIIEKVIGLEGGYSDHPDDSGGETNYGITETVARHYGYTGDMQELPKAVAVYIYTKEYWDKIHGDALLSIDGGLAEEVFDTAVNMGVSRSSEFLQECLNALNYRQQYYKDVVVDGHIGSNTVDAVRQYANRRDPQVLIKLLNCVQGAYYLHLTQKREKDEAFLYGWLKNRVNL